MSDDGPGSVFGTEAAVIPLYGHALLMGAAFLLTVVGFAVARYGRRRPGWLNRHRFPGVAGAAVAWIGLAFAIFLVRAGGGSHLSSPHGWVGLTTLALLILTPSLGQGQFHFRRKALLRGLHRGFGRTTLLAMGMAILLGLFLAGIGRR